MQPEPSPPEFPGYVTEALPRSVIREVAKMVFSYWEDIEELLVGKTFNIVYYLDAIWPHIDKKFKLLPISYDEMGDNLLGLAKPSEKTIEIREDIYVRARAGDQNAQLVVAHEFGHYHLHSELKFPKLADASTPHDCRTEHQADVFADELLEIAGVRSPRAIQLELLEIESDGSA
jgi:hypothetical protein